MSSHRLRLNVLKGSFVICRLDADAAVPTWATTGDFFSITRTRDELSIVCRQEFVAAGVQAELGWRALRIAGTLPFSAVGILASLVPPLAEAGISVFAVSTFDTDYLLVKEKDFENACEVLRGAGHEVDRGE